MNTIERRSVRGGPAVQILLEAACQAFHVRNLHTLLGDSKVQALARARCYVAAVLRGPEFQFSTPEIGKVLGGRNPSTVSYYLKRHESLKEDGGYCLALGAAELIRARERT